ncbi:hypothetical protein C8R42DRAFT_723738 [Lentinula raphanica]|nr:hypothetical protein C8R42DRAFT_723738 [Lentinula raphanica]
MPLTLRVVKSIPRKVKGRFGKSCRGARSSPGNVGSGGTGIADQSCGPSTTSPYAKQSTRSTYWDLSEQVLSTLMTAAQVAPVPYLGSLSALALSIFKAVQGAKENQEALGELSKTACDFASFVLSTYQELHPSNTGSDVSQVQPSFSSDPTLNAHVEQLVKTLQNIDKWIKGVQSRKLVRRLISYKSDLRAIQNFRSHLGEAKDNFKVQSLIALQSSVTRTEQNDVT